jgi:hypothetical protein
MINNTNRRKQWLIDWDEYAIYRERAIYRAGAFVVMVTSTGCPAPYIFELKNKPRRNSKKEALGLMIQKSNDGRKPKKRPKVALGG